MLKKHILIFLLIIGLVSLYYLLDITCPFMFLFKVPCPTCGITRSLLCLLRLDFNSYLHYNVFTIPVILASLVIIHSNHLKGLLKNISIPVSLVILIANFAYYIFRLLNYLNVI